MADAAGLYYEETGHGPVIILSSGLGGSADYWAPNIAELARTHRVIRYDHRGTGRSDRTIDGVLTIERIGEDILTLMDALDIPSAALIGHAIGGMAGLALAIGHPDRVASVVAINCWAKLDPHTARCFDTRLTLLRQSPRAYLHAQPLFLYPPRWISAHHDQLESEEEVLLAHFPETDMVHRRIAAARRFDISERLGDISARVLLIASEDDMLVPPSCSETLAEGIPHAQLAMITRGGHAVNVTRADEFNMWLVDWFNAN